MGSFLSSIRPGKLSTPVIAYYWLGPPVIGPLPSEPQTKFQRLTSPDCSPVDVWSVAGFCNPGGGSLPSMDSVLVARPRPQGGPSRRLWAAARGEDGVRQIEGVDPEHQVGRRGPRIGGDRWVRLANNDPDI